MSGKVKKLIDEAQREKDESSLSFAEKFFADENKAAKNFSALQMKLLQINQWNRHSMLSSYRLFAENGQPLQTDRLFVEALIRISLKGSGKYDWVRVINIFKAADEFIITVRPVFDPTEENPDRKVISHFFTDASTNNFCLWRRREKISFYVIGLEEKMNTDETKNTLETIRNAAVNLSLYLGIQKGEWEKFCHNFLEDADEK